MRILVVTNYYPPFELGGWEQLTQDVSLQLKERGHFVHILTSNYRCTDVTAPEPDVSRLLHLESLDHVHYHLRYSLTQRRHEVENQRIIEQAINDHSPDIVYVNGMWNLSCSVVRTAEQLCPGRVVYYIASYWPAELDAHTAYWQNIPANPWLRLPKKITGKFVQRWLLSTRPRNQLDFRLVLCVSNFMRQNLIKQAGIPEERTKVVYNAIDPHAFPMRALDGDTASLRLLYAGRLSPDKGVHTIIEALAYLRQTQPDMSIRLSIIGVGAPEYEAHLRQLTLDREITHWVHFGQRVPREQMTEVLAAHDALIFPSIWPEPLARMVQEAMACGLVVIGTLTGGTPEILFDGVNGLAFSAGDGEMLADKISLIANDLNLRIKLAEAARLTVEERFSLNRMLDELEMYFIQMSDQANIEGMR